VKPASSPNITTFLRDLPGQRDYKSEAVLDVSHFGLADQPLPIKIVIPDGQPRKGLENADLDVMGRHRRKEDGRGIVG
jgi:hypothetical protein